MSGTVTIIVARPVFGRAGRVKVAVDGTVVGKVRQGASLELTLDGGDHGFWVSGGGYRSRQVVLSVTEDSQQQLHAGVYPAVPMAAWIVAVLLGCLVGVLAIVPFILILAAVPGLWFYLRPCALSQSAEALEDAEEAAVEATAATGEPWWVNDPNLAKRYRN